RHMGASVAELSAADSGIGAHRNLRKSQECTSLCTVEIWMYRRECVGCTPKVFTRYTKECGAQRCGNDGLLLCQASEYKRQATSSGAGPKFPKLQTEIRSGQGHRRPVLAAYLISHNA